MYLRIPPNDRTIIFLPDYSSENHSQYQYVRDAVYAFAYALRNMHHDVCGPTSNSLCKEMAPETIGGDVLLNYLKMINFTGN